MRTGIAIHIVLFFMILAIGGFDHHLLSCFHGEVTELAHSGGFPDHHDHPASSDDCDEDIAIGTFFCDIPAPVEIKVCNYGENRETIIRKSPHTVWQPPERTV